MYIINNELNLPTLLKFNLDRLTFVVIYLLSFILLPIARAEVLDNRFGAVSAGVARVLVARPQLSLRQAGNLLANKYGSQLPRISLWQLHPPLASPPPPPQRTVLVFKQFANLFQKI